MASLQLIPTRYDSVWVHLPLFSASESPDLRSGPFRIQDSRSHSINESIKQTFRVSAIMTLTGRQNLPHRFTGYEVAIARKSIRLRGMWYFLCRGSRSPYLVSFQLQTDYSHGKFDPCSHSEGILRGLMRARVPLTKLRNHLV